MNLNEILQKTKKRAESIKVLRQPPSIATDDRPYEVEIQKALDKSRTNLRQAQDLPKNREQTGNKPGTNREQTGNKLGTNWGQAGDETGTNREQTGNKLGTKWEQTEDETGNKTENKLGTNWEQTGDKTEVISFYQLAGLQLKIVISLYKISKSNRSESTGPLTLETLVSYLESDNHNPSIDTIKTSLKRLELKKCVQRISFKPGRGGWSNYKLPNHIFQEILKKEMEGKLHTPNLETGNKPGTNREQTGNKLRSESGTQSGTSLLSSSINKYKTTTTLPEGFEDITFDSLEVIGFTQNHLLQIVNRSKLPAEVIQDSIDAFAFDLLRNNKGITFKKEPLNVFMGLLTKGSAYTPPQNYETPQQESLRLYLERKKAQIEKENQLQKEVLLLGCEKWKSEQRNQETIQSIVEEIDPMLKKINTVVESRILDYYEKNIWPLEKDYPLGGTSYRS